MRRSGFASFALLCTLAIAGSAVAQAPPPPPPPPPAPVDTSAPPAPPGSAQPPSAQPPSAAPPAGTTPAPGAPPPSAPPATGAPSSEPGAATTGGQASWQGSTDFGQNTSATGSASVTAPEESDADREWRRQSLHIHNSLAASTGLLHTTAAGSGAEGTFRVSFIGSYFSGSAFLCNGERVRTPGACPSPTNPTKSNQDSVKRIGARLGVSATLTEFMEAYLGFHSYATSNDQGRPELLQVLGDTDLGLKFFLPMKPDRMFFVGGEAQLWLLNGPGQVGIDAASFALRALATLDLNNRSNPSDRVPLRLHLNLGYMIDNSGKLVEDIETRRQNAGLPPRITRVERFGLEINRVDSVQAGFGIEGVFNVIRPFVEWTADVPIQIGSGGYVCNQSNAEFEGDLCLGNEGGFSSTPSRLTVGARVTPPFLEGLGLLAAVDIGTGATSKFLEEVAPEPPWMVYLGVGYAFDTQKPKPVVQRVEVEKPLPPPAPPEHYIAGVVVEKGTSTPVPDATIRFEGRNVTGMITGPDGTFRTGNLEPGTYTFNISATGYREGKCTATIEPGAGGTGAGMGPGAAPAGAPPAAGAAPGAPPGQPAQPGQPGAPPDATAAGQQGQPGQPATPGAAPGNPPPTGGTVAGGTAAGPNTVSVQCELEALPKVGNVVGGLVDAESNAPVTGAKVKITDRLNRELELNADATGSFRFENVPPGPVKITVDAPNYFVSVTEFEVKPREDVKARISLNKVPKKPNVVVTANELKLKKQVHFQTDSAEILPDSQGILEEIADVLRKRTDITSAEVQGHTDNTGTPAYNQRLSQMRAQAVVDALVKLGIDASRLTAKGYGQDKPIAPNNNDANRAKNRRVQIMIKK